MLATTFLTASIVSAGIEKYDDKAAPPPPSSWVESTESVEFRIGLPGLLSDYAVMRNGKDFHPGLLKTDSEGHYEQINR